MFIKICLPFLTVSGTESDTEENGFGTDLLLLRGLVSLVYLDLSDADDIEEDHDYDFDERPWHPPAGVCLLVRSCSLLARRLHWGLGGRLIREGGQG